MGKVKTDLTGMTFDRLTVLGRYTDAKDKKHTYWECQCVCGNTCIKRGDALLSNNIKNGKVKSCGCYKKEITSDFWSANLVNQRFGKLYVAKRVYNNQLRALWECHCDCGNVVYYPSRYLLSIGVNHCGCETKSQGELEIRGILNNRQINFQEQYSFSDCLSPKGRRIKFDFAIIQNENVIGLIEFNGQQHYEPVEFFGSEERFALQQEIDEIKRKYCKDNQIPLLEVSYKKLGKINLDDFLTEINVV